MSLTSTKRRNIMIAAVIIVVLAVSSIGAVIYLLTEGNVTTSGQAFAPTALWGPVLTVQTIEFQDTRTGTETTFHFHFAPPGPQNINPVGNYSVTLKNGHTYNVFISYLIGYGEKAQTQTDFITTFTVNATAGQTAINKDF
jgi:hypothetical protein